MVQWPTPMMAATESIANPAAATAVSSPGLSEKAAALSQVAANPAVAYTGDVQEQYQQTGLPPFAASPTPIPARSDACLENAADAEAVGLR